MHALARSWLNLKDTLTSPQTALERVVWQPDWLLVFLLVLASYGSSGLKAAEALPGPVPPGLLVLGTVAGSLVLYLLEASLVHGVARAFGGRGSWQELLRLYALTFLPGVLASLVALAFMVVLSLSSSWYLAMAALAVTAVVTLGTLVWSVLLFLKAVRTVYGFGRNPWAVVLVVLLVWAGAGAVTQAALPSYPVSPAAFAIMEPTLRLPPGASALGPDWNQETVVSRLPVWGSWWHRGDLVAVQGDGVFLARVLALPGDQVLATPRGIWVNGHKLREPYLTGGERAKGQRPAADWQIGLVRLAPGTYLVLGDNRALPPVLYGGGLVRREQLLGKVLTSSISLMRVNGWLHQQASPGSSGGLE
ncbi:MAG: YIP1 family protein [Firmicutes bacterium]|nr:YIP1 family protein [Bacillota bacterium]